MYDILYENVELQNKDLLDKIREFIWFSGKSDLNILLEQGKVSEVIDELDKLGFRINLGLYNEICLNTPLDQQTDQMKNFMKVFADSQKLDGLDVGAVNRNEVYVALFVSLAILSFIGACAAIATSIVHKRTPVNFILDPQNYGICSMKFGNCDLCGM
jgi:hypothetical protein